MQTCLHATGSLLAAHCRCCSLSQLASSPACRPVGNVEAKQEEIRKRLQLAGRDSKPSLAAAQDYYTSTEMAQFQQPKKKRVSVLQSPVEDWQGVCQHFSR